MKRPRLPRVALGVICLFLGFTPYFVAVARFGHGLPSVFVKLLLGLGLVVTAVLFGLAERFGFVKTASDLTRLFPEPEPEPETFSLRAAREVIKAEAASVLPPTVVAGVADLAQEHATDTALQAVKDSIL